MSDDVVFEGKTYPPCPEDLKNVIVVTGRAKRDGTVIPNGIAHFPKDKVEGWQSAKISYLEGQIAKAKEKAQKTGKAANYATVRVFQVNYGKKREGEGNIYQGP